MTETTLDSLLEAVEQIAPVLREHSAWSDEQRCLAEPVVDAMTDVGLYRIWIPKAYGGMEADPVSGLQTFEAVARIDSAADMTTQGARVGIEYQGGRPEMSPLPKGAPGRRDQTNSDKREDKHECHRRLLPDPGQELFQLE